MNETEDIKKVLEDIGFKLIKLEKVKENSKMPTYFVMAHGKCNKISPDGQFVTWMANKRQSEEHFSLNWGHYFQTNPLISKEKCEKMALKDFHRRVKEARANSR